MIPCSECGGIKYNTGPRTPKCLSAPADVYALLKQRLAKAKTERLIVLLLDAQNAIIGNPLTVSVGSLNTTRTHPREIFAKAIVRNALAIIIAHNHPSGSLDPSRDDLEFTKTVARAGELLGIALYDHLIISKCGYTSLKERGLMQ